MELKIHASYLVLVLRGRRSSPAPGVSGCERLQLQDPSAEHAYSGGPALLLTERKEGKNSVG